MKTVDKMGDKGDSADMGTTCGQSVRKEGTKVRPISKALQSPRVAPKLSPRYPHIGKKKSTSELALEIVAPVVCEYYSLSMDDLMERSRRVVVVEARQMAWFLLRYYSHLSFPAIGRLFGKDHTTVMYGVKMVDKKGDANVVEVLASACYPHSPQP